MCAAAAISGAPDNDAVCDKTCRERRLEFRYVVYVGKEIYCYWPEKLADTGTDFDALARDLEARIVTETTLTEHYRILRRWASAFHDGHVNVLPPDDLAGFEIYSAPAHAEVFAPATDHEAVYVTEPGEGGLLEAGDEVISVDGKPVAQALDEGESDVSGSTKRMRRFAASRRLFDALGSKDSVRPLDLEVRRNGIVREVSLFRRVVISLPPPPGTTPAPGKPQSTGIENVRATVLPSDLGYLRIDAFSGSQNDAVLDAAMKALAFTKGLLIDVRANGGGDLSGNRILGRLSGKKVDRYDRSERLSPFVIANRPDLFEQLNIINLQGAFADWHAVDADPIADAAYLGKPVLALVGTGCFSACDTFVAGLQANGLAEIAGEASGGGTGTPLVFDLPKSPFKFRYSVVRGRKANGAAIEGIGTAPEFPIERSPADLGTARDAQLADALVRLAAKAGVPAPNAEKLARNLGKSLGGKKGEDAVLAPSRGSGRRMNEELDSRRF